MAAHRGCLVFFFVLTLQDPTNLQTKLQKHHNFEAEIDANKTRIENIHITGQQLIDKDHYAKGPIR